MNLAALAAHLGATLRGDPSAEIIAVAGIERALPGHVTFVSNPKYAALARTTQATAILVEEDFPDVAAATLRLANPYLAFARAIELFYTPPSYPPGIHPTAIVDATASIGPEAHIGPYAVIGPNVIIGPQATILAHAVVYEGVRAGAHLFLHAHAVIREHCTLGDHVTIQNGAIVGADGFGFARQKGPDQLPGGPWYKILQSGPAILEENVEVPANACIDRASNGATRIRPGAKIAHQVQLGHRAEVGEATLVCAQAGLAGSSIIGNNVILAGQTGVAGHCHVGDGVVLTAQSGIHGDVAPGKVLSGTPAFDNRQWLRSATLFSKLPEIIRDLKAKTRT